MDRIRRARLSGRRSRREELTTLDENFENFPLKLQQGCVEVGGIRRQHTDDVRLAPICFDGDEVFFLARGILLHKMTSSFQLLSNISEIAV
jgi:hypothetical protein